MYLIRWFLLVVVGLCGCASTPTQFQPNSAANPNAPAAPRLPVANVLADRDPLAARVCPESGPCALSNSPAPAATSAESEHQHHHHH